MFASVTLRISVDLPDDTREANRKAAEIVREALATDDRIKLAYNTTSRLLLEAE